jgi:hypothetical protein
MLYADLLGLPLGKAVADGSCQRHTASEVLVCAVGCADQLLGPQ